MAPRNAGCSVHLDAAASIRADEEPPVAPLDKHELPAVAELERCLQSLAYVLVVVIARGESFTVLQTHLSPSS